MATFQVIHGGETYLVDGDMHALQAEFATTARTGGGYVTFQAPLDAETNGPVSIYISPNSAPTIVAVNWEGE